MMLKNLIKIMFTVLICSNSVAQVGIGTDNPRPEVMLDVNGNINVTDRIYLGGSDLNIGNDGLDKQLIVSGGDTDAPDWETKQIPAGFGESFTMTYMNTYYDTTGVDLATVDQLPYNLDQQIDTDWKILEGLNHEFVVYKSGNKVNFIFQTTGQITVGSGSSSASFACGLFLNSPGAPTTFRLKGVRTDAVRGISGSNKIINMNVTLENLPVPGGAGGTPYQVRVACRGRNVQSSALGIGKVVNATYLNQEMAQSTLNIFVLETWE